MVKSDIYHSDTRPHANFHQPAVNFTKHQQGGYHLDVEVFNPYPANVENMVSS